MWRSLEVAGKVQGGMGDIERPAEVEMQTGVRVEAGRISWAVRREVETVWRKGGSPYSLGFGL